MNEKGVGFQIPVPDKKVIGVCVDDRYSLLQITYSEIAR